MSQEDISKSIQKGLNYLLSVQKADGSFDSYSSPTKTNFKPEITYQTTFGPAIILSALNSVDGSKTIAAKLASWLMDQKSPNWSFNYWAESSRERQTMPYPDDLDDTFCALIALYGHDPKLIDGACLGKVVRMLVATESKVGGPYKTWLVPADSDKEWTDVDLAINANIACFLSRVAEPLPNLTSMIDSAIKSGKFNSPYYPSAYPIIYYLARVNGLQNKAQLVKSILRLGLEDWWGTALQSSLAISSLAQLDGAKDCGLAVQKLLSEQNNDGSWDAEAFCLDPEINKKAYYSGLPALTTALVLEALSLFAAQTKTSTSEKGGYTKPAQKQLDPVEKLAYKEINGLPALIGTKAQKLLKTLQQNDQTHEITMLPELFNKSLKSPINDKKTLNELGIANLYGWMAYTIYDDFLDNEGDPKMLSLANTTLRYSVKHFALALPNREFQALVEETFNIIDGANTWELENCRLKVDNGKLIMTKLPKFPNTLSLADRSLGHTLSPIGVLVCSGLNTSNQTVSLVQKSLRHYIVARQLADDMHDWEQDLKNGICTYVVNEILGKMSLKRGRHDLKTLLPKMQKIFWHEVVKDICQKIADHNKLARKDAAASGLLSKPNILDVLTDKIDKMVNETLTEQTKAQKFLSAYRGN